MWLMLASRERRTVLTATSRGDESSLSAYANGEGSSLGHDEAPEMQS